MSRAPIGRLGRYNTPHVPPTSSSAVPLRTFINVLPGVDGNRLITSFYRLSKKLLGSGHFGTVVSATHIDTESQFAVKIIRKAQVRDAKLIRTEVDLVRSVYHPDIVEVLDVFEDQQNVYLVMDHCAGGELFDRIAARRRYSEKHAAQVVRVCTALSS